MPTRLLIPGFMGSGPGHWQHIWSKQDASARFVIQDDWEEPKLASWLSRLEEVLARHPGATLVAHSLGAILVARLAERPARHLVGAALLVAPCALSRAEALHPGRIDFGTVPRKRLPFKSIVVASRNDPYMQFGEAEDHAKAWGADLIDLGSAGHINPESGYGHWPEGASIVADLERNSASTCHRPDMSAINQLQTSQLWGKLP